MSDDQGKLGAFPFVFGGLSFIPVFGIVFGIITIIWGLRTPKHGGKKLAIVGSCGIGLTLLYAGWVNYMIYFDEDLMAAANQNQLTSLVKEIELYKINNGKYPESLEVLSKFLQKESEYLVYDQADAIKFNVIKPSSYHYTLDKDSHYYLLSVGPDKKPFTSDDVLPDIEMKGKSGFGLLIHDGSKKLL